MFRKYPAVMAVATIAAISLEGCVSNRPEAASPDTATTLEAVFTVKAEGERSVVRAITQYSVCPAISWSNGRVEAMRTRAAAAHIPLRGDSAQADSKPAVFDALTCEIDWPNDASSATVAGRAVPAPAPTQEVRRIVVVADTGCRMKASENAFQPCNDPVLWPFAQVAKSAAALKPDLVIHIGDIHYRESPCPAGNAGCAGSAWGYGLDAWRADFFEPAAPLLAAAPWLYVRGNHESCFRAGQGWFRFVDSAAWSEARSCDAMANDADADFTAPYAVPVGVDSQFIVFDSSKSSGKAYAETDPAFSKYAEHLKQVGRLAENKKHSYFLSHHPLLAFAPVDKTGATKPGGSRGLQSAFANVYPERLFPDKVDVVMHGHVHLFEALSFATTHPVSLVMGNSGSATEGRAPVTVPAGTAAFPGALVDDFASRSDYGFALLERVDNAQSAQWRLTEFDTLGRAQIVCDIQGTKSRCKAAP